MKWRELANDPLFNLECFLDSQDKTIEEKDKEIERLNNIINGIEKLINEYELGKCDYSIPVFILKDKLKELKESDNNE